MVLKLLLSEEKLEKICLKKKGEFLNSIKNKKKEIIDKICKENFLEPTEENFIKLYPKGYFEILMEVFQKEVLKVSFAPLIENLMKEKNFKREIREKSKPLEVYFLYNFLEKVLDEVIKIGCSFYYGEGGSQNLTIFLKRLRGLYGFEELSKFLEEFIFDLNFSIQNFEIDEIFSKIEGDLEKNFFKVKDKKEVPSILLAQMGINVLNIRKPYLFSNLREKEKKVLLEKFLKLKDKANFLCYLYSITKYLIDNNFQDIDYEKFKKDFLMNLELEGAVKVPDKEILEKAKIFARMLLFKEYELLSFVEENFEKGEIFINICKDIIKKDYKVFVENSLLPFIKEKKEGVYGFRNLLAFPSYILHRELEPLQEFKEKFYPYLEDEEIIEPLKNYEDKIKYEIEEEIKKLKENFSKISKEDFEKKALKILEKISNSLLFWDDYGKILQEFASTFLHLPQIPANVLNSFLRFASNYLNVILDEDKLIDMPPNAKPKIVLLETLREAKEKGKILSISEHLKEAISYPFFEEVLFEYKLSTPYRDFYSYIKNFLTSKDSKILLKEIIEVLQKEDYDFSLSQKIFQELSFLSDLKEKEIFTLLLDERNINLYKNELKEKIFKVYPFLSINLKEILKEKGYYLETLEIEFTRKEKAFSNFLKELNLEKSIYSFEDYLKTSKMSYEKEEKGFWEEQFISLKHYLIQIEPKENFFHITLYVSGQKEGLHPFEGQQLKSKIVYKEEEMNWNLLLFQRYASFLLDLEEEIFEYEYKKPEKKRGYKIKRKKEEKVISFKMQRGKFLLKLDLKEKDLKKIWAKGWAPFHANLNDETEAERDLRFLLSILKNVIL